MWKNGSEVFCQVWLVCPVSVRMPNSLYVPFEVRRYVHYGIRVAFETYELPISKCSFEIILTRDVSNSFTII